MEHFRNKEPREIMSIDVEKNTLTKVVQEWDDERERWKFTVFTAYIIGDPHCVPEEDKWPDHGPWLEEASS